METIETTSTALGLQFDLHTRLFNNVLEGIDESTSNQRANDYVNHIKWIAGHILATRLSLYQLGGFEQDNSLDEFFGHGHGLDDTKDYPSIELIMRRWNDISSEFGSNIARLPEEVLNGNAPTETPIHDNTMRGFLAFIASHEIYHIGQVGILRKYIGKDAMSYN